LRPTELGDRPMAEGRQNVLPPDQVQGMAFPLYVGALSAAPICLWLEKSPPTKNIGANAGVVNYDRGYFPPLFKTWFVEACIL
jgi:hypothetical protein